MESKIEIENRLKQLVEETLKKDLSETDFKQFITVDGENININFNLSLTFPIQLFMSRFDF